MNNSTVYELWFLQEEDGSESLTLVPEDYEDKEECVGKGAKLIKKFKVSSYEEAKRLQHEYLGWEPYKPMNDADARLRDD